VSTQAVRRIPEIAYCQERKRLLEEFILTMREIIAWNNQQMEAVIEGDEDSIRFDLQISMATLKKYAAKYALLQHIREHGC
jgi:hypothetical protein